MRCSKKPSFVQFNAQASVIERPVFSLIGYVALGHEFFALPMRLRMVLSLSFYGGERHDFGCFSLAGRNRQFLILTNF